MDLVGILRPDSGYAPRRVLTLIKQRPLESRTVSALRGGEQFNGWGVDRYLMASVVDAINQNTYAFVSANSKKKPKAPEPVKRPEQGKQKTNKPNPFSVMVAAHLGTSKDAN